MKLNKLNQKHQFEWFVGFAEGDGSWQTDTFKSKIYLYNKPARTPSIV